MQCHCIYDWYFLCAVRLKLKLSSKDAIIVQPKHALSAMMLFTNVHYLFDQRDYGSSYINVGGIVFPALLSFEWHNVTIGNGTSGLMSVILCFMLKPAILAKGSCHAHLSLVNNTS